MDDYMIEDDDNPPQPFGHQNGSDRAQTSAYTLRRPTAPSHPVPPPSLLSGYNTATQEGSSQNGFTLTLDIADCITPSRLSPLTHDDLHHITTTPQQSVTAMTTSWEHEMRWQIHRMLDWLYIGPCSAVKNESMMREHGITMVMVANGMRAPDRTWPSIEKAKESGKFEVAYIDATGAPARLVHQLNNAVRLINGHIKEKVELAKRSRGLVSPPRVLIACEDGNGRSAMIAGGYIIAMWDKGVDMVFAAQWVSSRRLSACFDDEVKGGLVQWGDIVGAMREVERQESKGYGGTDGVEVSFTLSPSRDRRKRCFEEDHGGGEAGMEEEERPGDWERFAGREGFAPFRDRSPRV